jgi:WD40 repeat protein
MQRRFIAFMILILLLCLSGVSHAHLNAQSSPNFVREIQWSPNGSLIAAAYNGGSIEIRNSTTNQVIRVLDGGVFPVFAWNPVQNNQLAFASSTIPPVIMDVVSGQQLLSIPYPRPIVSVAWSPDGSLLAAGDTSHGGGMAAYGTIKIWNTTTGEMVHDFSNGGRSVTALEWNADGTRLIAEGTDGNASRLAVWDIASEMLIESLNGPQLVDEYGYEYDESISLGKWSPDGTRLFSVEGLTLQIRDTVTFQTLVSTRFLDFVNDVDWSYNGDYLAIASSGEIQILNSLTLSLISTVAMSTADPVHAVDWHPTRLTLAYGYGDLIRITTPSVTAADTPTPVPSSTP